MKRFIKRATLGALLTLAWAGAALSQQVNVYSQTGTGTGFSSWLPVSAANPLPVNATVTATASITGFPGSNQTTGTPIAVTTGGVTGTLPTGTVVVASNVGATNNAYCKLGASATTSDQMIPPNSWFGFTVGTNTQLTCITSTSTTTVNMAGGSGLPTGAGGGGSGGGGSNAAAGLTGSAVPGSASYTGLNLAGTLRGWTGVNPTGSVYAAQTDLASVGGTSFALGQQLAASSIPVVLTAAQITTLTPLSTVAATQSGAWNITNITGTVSLPTGAATAANQTNASQKTQIVDGSGNVIASTSNNLNVQCANCSGSGASAADEASFTAGTSVLAPGGGFYQTTATSNALTNGQQGMWQMTANRAGFVNLRNAAGAEAGVAAVPLQVSVANTAANGTAILTTGTGGTFPATQSGTWNITNVSGTVSLPTGAATSANQINASQKTQIVDGSGNVIAATSNALNVQCANCSGSGASAVDEAAFVAGTTAFAPSGGFYQTTATSNALTNGQGGWWQLTAQRAGFVNLRNASGTEIGTSTTPIVAGVTQWGGGTLGAMANYGTSPGAVLVPGTNAYVTNTVTVTGSGGTFPVTGAVSNASSAVATSSTNIGSVTYNYGFNGTTWDQLQVDGSKYLKVNATNFPASIATGTGAQGATVPRFTVATDTATIAGSAVGTAGSASTNVVTVQGIASGTSVPVSAASGSIASGAIASGAIASGAVASGAFASGAFAAGSFVNATAGDPCMFAKKTNLAISQNGTSSVQLIALSGSTTIYVCSLSLVAAGATTVAITTGTGTACVTGNAAVIGSTTANIANSMSFAANGGMTLGNGGNTIASGAASSELCMVLGTSVYVSGNLTYVQI